MKWIKTFFFQAFLSFEEMDRVSGDRRTHTNKPFLSKPIVEPDRKFTQLTFCMRFYHLAYNPSGMIGPIYLRQEERKIVETNGYTERPRKWFAPSLLAPNARPYDVVVWFWVSRVALEDTKNEWSYFRLSKRGMNALEWHHMCIVYNVPGKNTGIVLNGDIVANRNHSDLWANEDNFFHSDHFAPER